MRQSLYPHGAYTLVREMDIKQITHRVINALKFCCGNKINSQWLKKTTFIHVFKSGVSCSDPVSCCEWVLVCSMYLSLTTQVEGALAALDKLCSEGVKVIRA